MALPRKLTAVVAFLALMASAGCDHHSPLSPGTATAGRLVKSVPSGECETGTRVDLLADSTQQVGTVTVSTGDSAVYVQYRTERTWPLRRTAVFVGRDASEIPTDGTGNPDPARFLQSGDHADGTFDAIWEVPRNLSEGQTLVVVAFADVGAADAPEQAWGAGTPVGAKGNGATYFTHTVGPCGPQAVITAPDDGTEVRAGEALAFDASGSVDPAGGGLDYDWRFGDGEEGGTAHLAHVFSAAGTYSVTLEVTDANGETDGTRVQVNVTAPPAPTGTTTLHGDVVDPAGDPLEGVRVSNADGDVLGTTDVHGGVEIADFPTGVTALLRADLDGYSEGLVRLSVPDGTADAFFSSTLRPRNAAQTLADAGAGGTVSGEDGATISFPADGLVDKAGNPVSGAVSVAVTPIDVSGSELGSFPGTFTGIGADGGSAPIMSYGTAEFVVTQGGKELQLAPGKTASIDLPIYTTGASAGDHIPLWTLDEGTGLWIREGEGTVVDGQAGLVMRADIGHLSWWNVDYEGKVTEGYFGCYIFAPDRSVDYTQCYLDMGTDDGGPGWLRRTQLPAEGAAGAVPADRTLRFRARAFTADCLATGSLVQQIPSQLTDSVEVEVSCVDTAGSRPIAYGDDVSGSIDSGGSADAWVFAGESGDEARVDLTSTGLDGAYEITDPSGAVLANGTFGDETVFLDLIASGDYTITVSGALSDATGSYELALSKLVQPATVELTLPASVTGTMEFPSELDTYAFAGASGEEISVAAVRDFAGEGPLDGVWTLRSPSGAVIATESFGSVVGARSLPLPEDGTYALEVAATDGVPGGYRLEVDDAPSLALTYGGSASGSIDAALQVDAYRFTAASGDLVRIDLTRTSTTNDMHMVARAPTGDRVIDQVFPVGGEDQHPFLTVDQAGEYRVSIYGVAGNAPGAYGIGLEKYVPETPTTISIGDAITGEIGFPPEVDSLTFAGSASQQVVLEVGSSAGSSLEGTVRLLDPTSSVVASGSFVIGTSFKQLATLPVAGDYTIEVMGEDGLPGSYDLSVTEAPSSGPGALVTGDLIEASIDATGQVDEYTFDATAGDAVRVYAGPQANSAIDGYVTLLDPSGGTVFHRRFMDAYSVDRVEDLNATGTYTIQIDGTFSLGAYRLGLGTGSGRLDASFAGTGAVEGPQGTDYVRRIAELPGGNILALTDVALRRYDTDGALDATFGVNGVVDVGTLLGGAVEATSMAVQSDGAILVAAARTGSPYGWVLARLASDGSGLDAGFGTGGIVTIPFPRPAAPKSVLLVPDGGSSDLIVVGSGGTTADAGTYLTLARLNADGSMDSGFASGNNPLLTTLGMDPAGAVLQSTGQVVVAGSSSATARAYRFNVDGTQDTSFGTGGEASASIGATGLILGMTIRPNDDVVLTGYSGRAGTAASDIAVVQFTSAGAPDPSFGTGGLTLVDYGHSERGNGVTIDDAGNVLVAGTSSLVPSGGDELMVVRLDPSGALDGVLGVGGVVVEASPDDGRTIVMDSSGRILVGGRYLAGSGPYITNFALLRLLP